IEAGLMLAPLALFSFVVSAWAGRMSERVPLRGALIAGMLITAAGMLMLRAGVSVDATWLALFPGLAVTGIGVGLANPLTTFAHLGVLPPAQGGLASALNNTARQIGLAIGIAVLGALLEAGLDGGGGGQAFADGVGELLLISAGLSLLGALAAWSLVHQRDLWAPPGM
ncbi:MAG TPA: MFS transporter, partial [Solirubrobacteraceae bacterium]|nr:MFS transporter [Solirubrobacteraceae bacterium]